MDNTTKSPRVFYGWYVVAACFAVTLTLGETWWSVGVFVRPMETDFGCSRSAVSLAYAIFQIGFAISTIVSGRLVDRYSPRGILLGSAALVGLGSLVSRSSDVSHLVLPLFVVGLGAGATFLVPTYLVQHWFSERKYAGLALGVVVSGTGIGALFFVPLTSSLVLSYGWRSTYVVMSLGLAGVIAVAALITKKVPGGSPSRLEEDGSGDEAVLGQGTSVIATMLSPSFVTVALAASCGVLGFQVVSAHLVPHATGVGVPATTAAAAVGLMGAISVPGRILSGVVSDRIGWRKTLAMSLIGMGLSLVWLLVLDMTWMLYAFIIVFGTCHGMRIPAGVGIVGECFGDDSLGQLVGTSLAIGFIIAAIGPYAAGLIFDLTQDYFLAFLGMMVLLIAAGLVLLALGRVVTNAGRGIGK